MSYTLFYKYFNTDKTNCVYVIVSYSNLIALEYVLVIVHNVICVDYYFFSFTLYPTHRKVGTGNLVLRHSVHYAQPKYHIP